jgi:DNA-binding HxlR family transcriptional regulator
MFRTKIQQKSCDTCPVAKTANLIGDSVVLLIIRDLAKSAHRFSDFVDSFPGVSTRTLTKKLALLEDEGLITKKRYAEFPPRVAYSLTRKGKGLVGIITRMELYGKKYL